MWVNGFNRLKYQTNQPGKMLSKKVKHNLWKLNRILAKKSAKNNGKSLKYQWNCFIIELVYYVNKIKEDYYAN